MANEKWELVKLGDVVNVRKESVLPSECSDMKFVGLEHLKSGKYLVADYDTISDLRSTKSKFYVGDVLYGKLRPYLDKGGLCIFDGYCSTDILVLIADRKRIIPEYLANIIHQSKFTNYAMQHKNGTNHPRTSWSSLAQYEFNLPPLPEQQRIASILSAADKAIEEAGIAVEESERMKKGLMQELLTNSESRNYILNDVILEYLNGGTPSTKKPEYWNGDIHWTTSANLNGYYLNSGEKKITQDGLKHSSTNLVPKGNIIIATRVGLGKSVINCVDIAISQDLTGLILDQSKIDREYLAHYLKSDKVIQKIINSAQGTTIKGITRDALGNIPLLLPTISKQKRIAACLSTADEKISLCKNRKALLEKTKLGLMQKLLS